MKLREGNVFKPVCHSVQRREGVSPLGRDSPDRDLPPLDGDPPGRGTPRWNSPVQRLLECILVDIKFEARERVAPPGQFCTIARF